MASKWRLGNNANQFHESWICVKCKLSQPTDEKTNCYRNRNRAFFQHSNSIIVRNFERMQCMKYEADQIPRTIFFRIRLKRIFVVVWSASFWPTMLVWRVMCDKVHGALVEWLSVMDEKNLFKFTVTGFLHPQNWE